MRVLNKILLIRFSSMGDIVLSSPLIRALRTAYPVAQIDFILKREYAELLKYNPHLSSLIELRSDDPAELKGLRAGVHRERYDAIIDIHNSLRSRYVRTFAGARYVKVVRKRVIERFFLVRFKSNFYRQAVPVPERYLETVRKFGVRDDGGGLEIFVPEEITQSVATLLGKYKLEKYSTILGMAPMAKHFTKRWLPERYVELGARLAREKGAKILILGSKAESDSCGDIAQMINARAGSNAAESLAGRITLLETAAVLDHCTLLISNDTGIMHLGAARKKAVVAIFGSTVREFGFFPFRTPGIVLERSGLECRPCTHIGLNRCPKGHFRCMKEIEVDEVAAATRTLLAGIQQSQTAG
jgi:lipopolysaccharide heptosyltransferase II